LRFFDAGVFGFEHRFLRGGRHGLFDRIGFDHHQCRSDRHLIADLTRQFDHGARNRRFHLDRRLVGHHVGDRLILLDAVAELDVPGDDFGLGDAFADVGQAEGETSHVRRPSASS